MSYELKPCPFCGAQAKIYTTYDYVSDCSRAMEGKGWIECINEECIGGWIDIDGCDSAEDAAKKLTEAWNRRHREDEIVADLMRLSEDPWPEDLCNDWGHRGVVIRAFCDVLADTYKQGELLTTKPEGESHDPI